jgi:thiamine biosynthesis protein ThiS
MKIQVNGEGRTANAGVTVAELLRELDIRPDRVAVEVNTEVLNRQEFERRGLREGDHVEIIGFIGGGREEFGDLVTKS